MIESVLPLGWEGLNSDQKYEICDSLLQKTKHRNLLLLVENRNLKNRIKNMEHEMRGFRDALRGEECKFNQLNEKLTATMQKERQEHIAKEEELSYNVKLLQSKLQKEQRERQTLEERIKIVGLTRENFTEGNKPALHTSNGKIKAQTWKNTKFSTRQQSQPMIVLLSIFLLFLI
ncbi:uncharacterized protein LOC144640705 isoform X1 [Oculina patagonica]